MRVLTVVLKSLVDLIFEHPVDQLVLGLLWVTQGGLSHRGRSLFVGDIVGSFDTF